MTGLFAGILGLLVALGMIGFVYNQFPVSELGFLSTMLLIPMLTGVLGALLPAQRAVRITPNAAIGSVVINSKATERRFKSPLERRVASYSLLSSPSSSSPRPKTLTRRQLRHLKSTNYPNDGK